MGENDPRASEGGVTQPSPPPAVPPQDPLVRAIRSMRRWIIALTLLVTLVVGLVGAVAAYTFYDSFSMSYNDEDIGPNPAMIEPLKDSVTGILGDAIEDLRVYQVEIAGVDDLEDVPDRPFAISYRLRDAGVTVVGLVDDVADLDESGLTPTSGPLDKQLSMDEFKALATAWAARTQEPMGFVYAYTSDYEEDGYEPGEKISVGGTAYVVDDLWCVNDGWIPQEGATVTWDDVPDPMAAVFRIDRTAGTFTYVGSEPAQVSAYDSDYEGDW